MLSFLPNFKFLLKTLAISVPAGVTILDVIGYIAKVEGCSMQPALNPNTSAISSDYVFLHNWPIVTNSYEEIERGDIVTLVSPRDPRQRIIKRVVALSGDIVETRGYKQPFVRVPPGHCWIEGDHHGNSLDSNLFGPVALGLIKSKAKCIVWPPNRWQMLTKSSISVFPKNPPPAIEAPLAPPSYSSQELDLDAFDRRTKSSSSLDTSRSTGSLVKIVEE